MSSHISNSYLSKDSKKMDNKRDTTDKNNSGLNRKTSSKDFLASKENIKSSLLNSDSGDNKTNNKKNKADSSVDTTVVSKSKVKFKNPETEVLLNLLWEVSEEQAKTGNY